MKAVLIVNPAAGKAGLLGNRREEMLRICRESGWEASLAETGPEPGSAERLAREAVQAGARLVIAGGGDGTVHGVLQGVARTETMLGVLPLGTANALARNLHLPLDPIAALHRLMGCRAQRIPLGWAETKAGGRWFTVLAGAGPDGMLVQEDAASAGIQSASKRRFGRSAYYGRAARLFLTQRFPAFQVQFRRSGNEDWEQCEAVGVMASLVPNLGGLFRGLTAQSRLHHPFLQVQILRAPAHASLAAWVTMTHLRLARWNRMVPSLQVAELRCFPSPGSRAAVWSQVDGEATGELPLYLRMVPDALSLLAPGWAMNVTPRWPRARLRQISGTAGTRMRLKPYRTLCVSGSNGLAWR